jgi:hypothetical protein
VTVKTITMNTNFFVRNLNGTSGRRCRCGTWIDHWRRFSNGARITCARLECQNSAILGAHVQIVDRRYGRDWWIVPLCYACNNRMNDQTMHIDRRTIMISANVRFTCWDG